MKINRENNREKISGGKKENCSRISNVKRIKIMDASFILSRSEWIEIYRILL